MKKLTATILALCLTSTAVFSAPLIPAPATVAGGVGAAAPVGAAAGAAGAAAGVAGAAAGIGAIGGALGLGLLGVVAAVAVSGGTTSKTN